MLDDFFYGVRSFWGEVVRVLIIAAILAAAFIGGNLIAQAIN